MVGGAGYIGAYMCKCLAENQYHPVVLDDLSTGHREAVKWGPLYKGSLADASLLKRIFTESSIDAVMHFAAFCYVGESVSMPAKYYLNNVSNTVKLLDTMVRHNLFTFIFSSSCATYGDPVEIPITENHQQVPINPYGRTKLMVEQIMDDFQQAYGLNTCALRYFNAAGADPDGEIGEDHSPETHLIPIVLETALGKRKSIPVFGEDYPTRDGTCIRDYIHIADLASAHLLALQRLLNDSPCGNYNLGNGQGFTVKEVIDTACSVTGKDIPYKVVERRSGDPAILISSSRKAEKKLGWVPQYPDLRTIIQTAWDWHRNNPNGYSS